MPGGKPVLQAGLSIEMTDKTTQHQDRLLYTLLHTTGCNKASEPATESTMRRGCPANSKIAWPQTAIRALNIA
jgi:hypothetical protein